MSAFKLAVALPSLQQVDTDFAISLVSLHTYFNRVQVPGYEGQSMGVFNRRSSLIAKSRQELCIDARKNGFTHAGFIDSDQIFPPNLFHRLASHQKRVIGCNIATKSQESSIPTARSKPGPGEWWGGHIIDSRGKKGAEQVWRLGFGVMLLDLSIFDDVPFPWFNQQWYGPPINDFMGEDWFFCELMDKLGIPIWIDHEVSMRVGHIGRWIFDLENCVKPEVKKDAA